MRNLKKVKIADLRIDPKIKEVMLKVIGPYEEVYLEEMGNKVRIIL
ncbi:MAG: hypothetical protein ABWK05_09305 [Pyrobaculum sp.]